MRKMSIIKRVKEDYIEYTRFIYEPDKIIRGKFYEVNEINEKRKTHLARARREIIELIRLNLEPGSCLLTLTYRENMQDYDRAYKDFKKFVMRVKYNYNIVLRYLRVVELQQRGAIHFHVVIFSPEFALIPYTEIYETWGHGAVHVRKIKDIDDVTADRIGNYLGKYLSKSKDIEKDKKLYTTSRNLKRPEKERIVIEDERMQVLYEGYLKQVASCVVVPGGSTLVKYIVPKQKKCPESIDV